MRRISAEIVVAAALAIATLVAHGRALSCGFVTLDDTSYITQNPPVRAGLTGDGIRWAFRETHSANWHPLTWVSHMLDCELFGLNAAGHHLTNVLFHAANVVLVFLVFVRMTGRFWASAFLAALFALHPQRVESVAWVSERKDVLSTFFALLAMLAYARYAERAGSWRHYLPVLCCLALSLMAKAMWVTLPCVLLLLDCWPLRRWRPEQPWRLKGIGWLLIEKIPLLVLSAVSCGVTFAVQQSSKAVVDVVALPLQYRIGNALVSYAGYLKKTLVPIDLIVLYPHPGADLPLGQTALAAAILLIITLAALTNVRRWPFLLVGWLWYLGTLVPVIGLVQVGEQGMADRYSYGPSLGLFIMLSWSAASFVGSWRLPRLTVALGASAVLLTLGLLTWNQTSHWQNGETLWRHALAVDSQLDRAHIHLATIYQTRNQPERAVTHFNAALRLRPDDGNTHYNFANLLFQLGRHEEASQHYQHAIQINPNDASALCNHGSVLIQLGRPARAIQSFLQVLRISFAPQESLHAYRGLAQAYLEQGQHRDAIDALRQALQISPQDAPAHLYLGHAYLGAGRAQDAVRCYRHALQLDPSLTEAKRALTQQPATSSAASNPK